MDTKIVNGTKFDHIGIIDDSYDSQGLPKVINVWTTGSRTDSMDLLGNRAVLFPFSNGGMKPQPEGAIILYPEVVGHFRMTHLFDYQ